VFLKRKTLLSAWLMVACLALITGAPAARAGAPGRDPDQTRLTGDYVLNDIGPPLNVDTPLSRRYILILSIPALAGDDAPGGRGPAGLAIRRAAIAAQQAKVIAALAAVAPRATVERHFVITLNALVVRMNGADPGPVAALPASQACKPNGCGTSR
jgi:hypothetical protein